MKTDMRASPRLRCELRATADGPRGPLRGVCTNVSLSGLFLEGIQLPLRSMTRITVEHPTIGRFCAQVEIMRHSVTPKGMGVQFTRLEPSQIEVLQKLITAASGEGLRSTQ